MDKRFKTAYQKLVSTYGTTLAKINGVDEDQLYPDKDIDSIDFSANIHQHDAVTKKKEKNKPMDKFIAMNNIYLGMLDKYGKKAADTWLKKEWTGFLYMHDFPTTGTLPYCFAFDLRRMAEEGLFWLKDHNPQPAKHLCTFVDFVKEFINYTSNRQSGAVGLPNLIPYMYYFWKKDVDDGAYPRNQTPEKFAKSHIQRFIYAVNQPYTRDGLQSAFTNTSQFDMEYLTALFGGATFPDGSFMVDELDGIMQFQKWYLEEFSAIRDANMFTYPVNTVSILKDENDYPIDEDFAKYAIEHNMKWSDSNIFCDNSISSLSNCCRLKSSIQDLGVVSNDGARFGELGYFSSIGGTSLSVGSVKVSTINLERLALENRTEKKFLKALYDLVITDCQALDIVRDLIIERVEAGDLPNICDGMIDMSHMYNTVGFIGVYEALQIFGYCRRDEFGNTYYTDKGKEFGKKIFETLHLAKDTFGKDKNYKINCEQIPGESAACTLRKKDKMFFSDCPDDLPMIGNQFIPLGVKTTLQERIEEASLFDSYCNGGSILHVSIDAPFDSFEKAWNTFLYVIKKGVTYFAFNTKISSCKNNHAFYGEVCPHCGGKAETYWTRIVGFLVPFTTFSEPRKEEVETRIYENINK